MNGNTLYIVEWKEMWLVLYGDDCQLSYNVLLFHNKIIIIIVSSLAFALTAKSRSAISFEHFTVFRHEVRLSNWKKSTGSVAIFEETAPVLKRKWA